MWEGGSGEGSDDNDERSGHRVVQRQRLRTRDWGLSVELIKYWCEIIGILLATVKINR